jgi:hypothetical protein
MKRHSSKKSHKTLDDDTTSKIQGPESEKPPQRPSFIFADSQPKLAPPTPIFFLFFSRHKFSCAFIVAIVLAFFLHAISTLDFQNWVATFLSVALLFDLLRDVFAQSGFKRNYIAAAVHIMALILVWVVYVLQSGSFCIFLGALAKPAGLAANSIATKTTTESDLIYLTLPTRSFSQQTTSTFLFRRRSP